MTALTFCMVLVGVLLNAGAQLALKAGTNQIGAFNFSADNIVPIGLKIATNPYIFLGLSCYVISVVVWILALSRVPVSIAYPMLSIGYVVAAFIGWQFMGEAISAQKLSGIGFILIGVYLVARS